MKLFLQELDGREADLWCRRAQSQEREVRYSVVPDLHGLVTTLAIRDSP
eukprot:CAMPEP_0180417736 /NCGR_PEP_ID=MMETSP1036_2-20121128/1188_1 /TAXON_ID=632150 /ORGANISM="Azadinium spinosum, Strain 3D9" /LENGTH=48 /DNA_ID= /DNA_START= /DNA_END= /DNA_ORIENTATION=